MTVEQDALRALAYFAVFSHPLRTEEVFRFCSQRGVTQEEVEAALLNLAKRGAVAYTDEFYHPAHAHDWAKKRLVFNKLAEKAMPLAQKRARLIGAFPFVRGVLVSGSLSKGCLKPGGDVDFFVVTAPGRLWLARTLLALFKKLLLFNSHRFFCLNYFVDSEHLEIEEKNQFTAVETVTLLPMWGARACSEFFSANQWAWELYCPHFPPKELKDLPEDEPNLLKTGIERLLDGRVGGWLDLQAMHLTLRFWKRKFKHLPPDDFAVALKSERGVSKHHPRHFQKHVLAKWAENLEKQSSLPTFAVTSPQR